MPDGKTHDMINSSVLVAVLFCLYYLIWKENVMVADYLTNQTILAFSLSYLFATFFLSPDLDINSTPYRRWGSLRVLWWPYKVVFRHRGFSHHPVIGPLSIVLNLALMVIVLLMLSGTDLHRIPSAFIISSIAGIVLSMEVHIIADGLVSRLKGFL